MGTPCPPEHAKLFVAVLHTADFDPTPIMAHLQERFGLVEYTHGPVDFSWSDYYAAEMGASLKKFYACFCGTMEREALPGIKLWTNGLEAEHARKGKRLVNIDPGYLARDKLVLATTKDFFHRLHLADGIYGEVTLHLRQGVYRHFSWTYPDFKEEKLHELLFKARASLVGEVRKIRENGKTK